MNKAMEFVTVKNLILLLLLLIPAAFAQEMLQGGVIEKVKVDQAREAAFDKLPKRIDTRQYPKIDPDMIPNLQARLHRQQCLPDRRLTFFDDGGYASVYFGSNIAYQYNRGGYLTRVTLMSAQATPSGYSSFPMRGGIYDYQSGRLVTTRYTPALAEDYGFNNDGSLQLYCLNTTCYYMNGITVQRSMSVNCLQAEANIQDR